MTGHIVAAVNISAVALLTTEAELNGPLKAEVLAAANGISHDLGHGAAANYRQRFTNGATERTLNLISTTARHNRS